MRGNRGRGNRRSGSKARKHVVLLSPPPAKADRTNSPWEVPVLVSPPQGPKVSDRHLTSVFGAGAVTGKARRRYHSME